MCRWPKCLQRNMWCSPLKGWKELPKIAREAEKCSLSSGNYHKPHRDSIGDLEHWEPFMENVSPMRHKNSLGSNFISILFTGCEESITVVCKPYGLQYFVTDKVNTLWLSYTSSYRKLNSKWFIDLNVKLHWIRLSQENKEDLCDLELDNAFLAIIPKALSIKN